MCLCVQVVSGVYVCVCVCVHVFKFCVEHYLGREQNEDVLCVMRYFWILRYGGHLQKRETCDGF